MEKGIKVYFCPKCQIRKYISIDQEFDGVCKVCKNKMIFEGESKPYEPNVHNLRTITSNPGKPSWETKPDPPEPVCVPKCPTCGSTNVQKISGAKRWLTTGLFGLASGDLGKSMQCKNCGYKW